MVDLSVCVCACVCGIEINGKQMKGSYGEKQLYAVSQVVYISLKASQKFI